MDVFVRTLSIGNHKFDSNCFEQNGNFLTHNGNIRINTHLRDTSDMIRIQSVAISPALFSCASSLGQIPTRSDKSATYSSKYLSPSNPGNSVLSFQLIEPKYWVSLSLAVLGPVPIPTPAQLLWPAAWDGLVGWSLEPHTCRGAEASQPSQITWTESEGGALSAEKKRR